MFESQDQSSSSKLYTGNLLAKVEATSTENKNDQQIIQFQLKGRDNDISARLSFFTKDEIVVSKSGKTQYIDIQGRTKYIDGTPVTDDYFDASTARKAINGEEKLTKLISALANVKKGGACRFSDFSKIAKGDITELLAVLQTVPNNNVVVRLGVRDGKYQAVFNGAFERGWAKDAKNIEKALSNETQTKVFYGKAELKEYDPSEVQPDDATPGMPDMPITSAPLLDSHITTSGTIGSSLADLGMEFPAEDKKSDPFAEAGQRALSDQPPF